MHSRDPGAAHTASSPTGERDREEEQLVNPTSSVLTHQHTFTNCAEDCQAGSRHQLEADCTKTFHKPQNSLQRHLCTRTHYPNPVCYEDITLWLTAFPLKLSPLIIPMPEVMHTNAIYMQHHLELVISYHSKTSQLIITGAHLAIYLSSLSHHLIHTFQCQYDIIIGRH